MVVIDTVKPDDEKVIESLLLRERIYVEYLNNTHVYALSLIHIFITDRLSPEASKVYLNSGINDTVSLHITTAQLRQKIRCV